MYALQPRSLPLEALEERAATLRLFVLDEDLQARGLECPAWATCVDYPGFVELSVQHDKVNTWL